jgi:predicted RNA-binding protein with PIN domain
LYWIQFLEGGYKAVALAKGSPHYIIDGYNVILHGGYSSGRGHRSDGSVADSRYHFLRSLSNYARKKHVRITVVWDGGSSTAYPKSETHDGVQSIYTPHGLSADEQIVRMVEKKPNPRAVTVVSNDRRHIVTVVRNLGSQTMGVEQFLALIGNGRKNGGGTGRKSGHGDASGEKKEANDLSVEEWLKLFQVRHTGNRNET